MTDNVQSEEFEGVTTEEAIKKALAKFMVDQKKLDIKVVREEQKGLFGMKGAKSAKIKVSLKN